MKITLYFRVHVEPTAGRDRVYKREIELPAVPRIGDRIELTDGGWSEVVRDVWWNFDGSVLIEFKTHVTDSAGEQLLELTNRLDSRLAYVAEDELPALEEAGWEVT